jgi:hypothetical protein
LRQEVLQRPDLRTEVPSSSDKRDLLARAIQFESILNQQFSAAMSSLPGFSSEADRF